MSLPLASVVSVTVNLSSPGITREGFGEPLLLSNTGNAWTSPELTRSYTSGSFSTDFPSTTAEYAALTAIFAQPAPPTTVVVGKGPTKPTMVRTIGSITAVNSTLYKVNVFSSGSLWTASYTSDGSATIAEIVAGLVAQLTPAAWVKNTAYVIGNRVTNDTGKAYECTVAGTSQNTDNAGPTGTGAAITDGTVTWEYVATPNFTATNTASTTVTCTGNAAGNWFALEPIASGDTSSVSNLMMLTDTTADPSGHVSADLDAILSADSTWYALILLFKSSAILSTSSTGVSAWCAANERLLVASVSDTACATAAFSGGTDVLHTLTGQGSSYTGAQWHPRDYEFLDCCTDGYFLPIEPGSDNWRMKPLTGPTPVNLTPTQITNLNARRAGYYTALGSTGLNVLAGNGNVESTIYGFIDTRRNIDWYRTNLQEDLIDLEVSNNKLSSTSPGRRKIAVAIAKRNDIGIQKSVISSDPLDPTNAVASARVFVPYTVTVPPVTDPDSFDPTTRALTGISTRWRLDQPINSMAVTVNVIP